MQALSQVKPFPSYFVTNESSKEPWRTEEHCLFVFERAFQRHKGGGKVVKLWESRLTERRDREGELRSIVKIEVLTQLRPPDRFPAPTNRCFICVCLPTLL